MGVINIENAQVVLMLHRVIFRDANVHRNLNLGNSSEYVDHLPSRSSFPRVQKP